MCRHTSLRSENQTTSIPLKRLNLKNYSICTTPIYFIIIQSQIRIRLTVIKISNKKNNRYFYLDNKQRLLLKCVMSLFPFIKVFSTETPKDECKSTLPFLMPSQMLPPLPRLMILSQFPGCKLHNLKC